MTWRREAARAALIALAALPAIGLALAALAPLGWWPAILAAPWAPHLALLALPLWCWQGRRPLIGAALLVLILAALWPHLAAAYAPRAPAVSAADQAFTVTTANLYARNRERPAALEHLAGDLVALIETLPADRARLQGDARWPHQHWALPREHSGAALLSRFPLRARSIGHDGAYGLDAQLDTPWGPLRCLVFHAYSPRSPALAEANRRQLAWLAEYAAAHPGPLLLVGDLNATAADPGLRRLRAVGLRAPADATPATWPSWLGPAGIGIDHILVRGLAADRAHSLPLPGSDHRALSARIAPLAAHQ